MVLRVSILDRSPSNEGESSTQSLTHTVQLAKSAEALGFHRFWVSEHHGADTLLGSSPEVLISYLLASTNKIRVGSGGVMLQHYSPFKVAENFNLLATLAPDRVDLGIGRAPGGLPLSSKALQGEQANVVSLDEKLLQLADYIRKRKDPQSEEYQLLAQPLPATPPSLYLLGANVASAELAAKQGLAYVYASFINGDEENAEKSIAAYRNNFDYSTGRKPELIVAISALTADSASEAEKKAADIKVYKVHFEDGKSLSINTLAGAKLLGSQANRPYVIETKEASIIHGSSASIRPKLLALQEKHKVDELIVLPAVHSYAERLQIYESIAKAVL